MKQEFIVRRHHSELLLFFAGWGMDAIPFSRYCPYGTDVCICYDYRADEWHPDLYTGYSSIRVIAWSMGVRMASEALLHSGLPIVEKVAVNGTLYPADETRGIPPALLKATIDHLSEQSLIKFYRRMCGPKFAEFMIAPPHRSIEELKEELIRMTEKTSVLSPADDHWDSVVIGRNDRIFPYPNQEKAWGAHSGLRITDDYHYPDFNLLFHENHR